MALPDSGNRKRQRYLCEDEISEFTPLSKRINNLHINNSFFPFVKQMPLAELKPDMHRAMMNGRLSDFEAGSSRNIDSALEADPQAWGIECYSPDLTPAENPYYYESNRLLYELYMQRSQRSHLPSPNGHF
ncbi:uncharacterized protein [Halyomorpha halys]|uniref:uncharacterized protein n=1 Tax=Halyomorpha halys TaxID=286706 RepID=UPI0006D4FA02|nr:uncharacterized protein LOC106677269 [Halyomorpha halys]